MEFEEFCNRQTRLFSVMLDRRHAVSAWTEILISLRAYYAVISAAFSFFENQDFSFGRLFEKKEKNTKIDCKFSLRGWISRGRFKVWNDKSRSVFLILFFFLPFFLLRCGQVGSRNVTLISLPLGKRGKLTKSMVWCRLPRVSASFSLP